MNRPLAALVAVAAAAGFAVLAFGASRYTSDELNVLLTLIVLGALAERYAAGVFAAFGERAGPEAWPEVVTPALLGTLANFAVNSGLAAAAISLSNGESALARWRQSYAWLTPQYAVIGLAALAAASAYSVLGLWGLAVFAAPIAGIRHAFFLGAGAQAAGGGEAAVQHQRAA